MHHKWNSRDVNSAHIGSWHQLASQTDIGLSYCAMTLTLCSFSTVVIYECQFIIFQIFYIIAELRSQNIRQLPELLNMEAFWPARANGYLWMWLDRKVVGHMCCFSSTAVHEDYQVWQQGSHPTFSAFVRKVCNVMFLPGGAMLHLRVLNNSNTVVTQSWFSTLMGSLNCTCPIPAVFPFNLFSPSLIMQFTHKLLLSQKEWYISKD